MKRHNKVQSGFSCNTDHLLLNLPRAPAHSCSDSPEVMEVQTVDGRVITVASAVTQTDWDWVGLRQQKDSSSGPLHRIQTHSRHEHEPEPELQATDLKLSALSPMISLTLSTVHVLIEDLVETPAEELPADLGRLVIAPDLEVL